MIKTLVKNARLVNEGRVTEGDLLIEDERIARRARGWHHELVRHAEHQAPDGHA